MKQILTSVSWEPSDPEAGEERKQISDLTVQSIFLMAASTNVMFSYLQNEVQMETDRLSVD